MGLDQYLHAKRFIWFNEEDLADTLKLMFPGIRHRKTRELVVEALYWRKSNAIHKWFVDNIQNGSDDCGHYSVSREDLESLRDLILEVLKSRDSSKLPPQSGFFFGSTDVDQGYWQDLEHTAAGIEQALSDFDEKWDFEYYSSW